MNIFPVGTALFRADRRRDRRTDLEKLIVVFRNFANAHKQDITRGTTVGPLGVPVLLQSFFHLQIKKRLQFQTGSNLNSPNLM